MKHNKAPKTVAVSTRLTDQENARLAAAARKKGISKAAYVREKLLTDEKPEGTSPGEIAAAFDRFATNVTRLIDVCKEHPDGRTLDRSIRSVQAMQNEVRAMVEDVIKVFVQ